MKNKLSNQWNWGGFLLCPFWCIRYQVSIGIVSVLPVVIISSMSLVSLISFSLFSLILTVKIFLLPSGILLSLLFGLIYITGNIFLILGKTNAMIGLVFFYTTFSILIGLNGNRLALKKMKSEEDIQDFEIQKNTWRLLGIFLSVPLNFNIFYSTEKMIELLIDLVQLPGI